jgi:O-antigen/teichoic acid export membrane protein
MYLGRKLSVEVYGTYKQLMLFFWFSQVALNLGIDDSSYYFMRKNPEKFPLYSFNAMLFNLLVTGSLWGGLTLFNEDIAILLNNPELAHFLPLIGLLIFATVSSMQIEGLLNVGINRFNDRLIVEMGTELLKSLAIIGGFYFFNSVYAVFIFLSVIMIIRLMGTLIIIHSCKKLAKLSYLEAPHYIVAQLKFGLPLGFSRLLQNILNMENFFISSYFSLMQFTYYTVGCFENPLVNAARISMFELANIEMVDAMRYDNYQKAIEVWKSMTRKLFMIIIPFSIYMIFFAKEIITFIFSEKYLQSVPYFMIFNLYLIVGALNPEPLFRATSKTQQTMKIKFIGVAFGVFLLVGGAYLGGPLYALIGKILGVLMMNIAGLVVGAGLLKTQFKNLFRWKDLVGITLLSLGLAAVIKVLFWKSEWSSFWILAISFSLYLFFHFYLSCWTRLIKDDEIIHLKQIFNRFILKK